MLKGLRQVKMIDNYCIQVTGSPIPLIFFKKMQADIYRYLAEFSIQEERIKYKELALKKYKEGVYTLKCLRELRI